MDLLDSRWSLSLNAMKVQSLIYMRVSTPLRFSSLRQRRGRWRGKEGVPFFRSPIDRGTGYLDTVAPYQTARLKGKPLKASSNCLGALRESKLGLPHKLVKVVKIESAHDIHLHFELQLQRFSISKHWLTHGLNFLKSLSQLERRKKYPLIKLVSCFGKSSSNFNFTWPCISLDRLPSNSLYSTYQPLIVIYQTSIMNYETNTVLVAPLVIFVLIM